MTAPDPVGDLLAAMLTAWRLDIDSAPLRDFEPAVLRGEHTDAHALRG